MKFTLPILLLLTFCATNFAQQTDRDRAIELFKQGSTDAALSALEKLVKTNGSDAEARNYLGLTYLRKRDNKKARQQLEKAVQIDPMNSRYQVNLAYVYLLGGDNKKARSKADEVLKTDPKNVAAYYVRGKANLAEDDLDDATIDAEKAIALEPGNPQANLLKADAYFEKYVAQIKRDFRLKGELGNLRKAAEILDNCLENCTKNAEMGAVVERRDIVSAFMEAVERKSITIDPEITAEMPDPGNRRVKILSKPRASYTDQARQANISGTITLLVLFGADGTIPYIILVRGLDGGLDGEAVKAARQIKFEPKLRDGKPVASAAFIQYGFSIY